MTRVPDGFTAAVERLTDEYDQPLQIAVRTWIVQQIQDDTQFAETWLSCSEVRLQALLAAQDALTALDAWKPEVQSRPWIARAPW